MDNENIEETPETTAPPVEETEATAASKGTLEEKVDMLQNMVHELGDAVEARDTFIDKLMTGIQERTETQDESLQREAELLFDPYEMHAALTIKGEIPPDKTFPLGQVLSYKNPKLRSDIGYKGWVRMTWDDPYLGESDEQREKFLSTLISAVPSRMQDGEDRDNFIRRGDSILCRLDKRVWFSRQRRREIKSLMRMEATGDTQQRGNYGAIVGPGLTSSKLYKKDAAPRDGMTESGRQFIPRELPEE